MLKGVTMSFSLYILLLVSLTACAWSGKEEFKDPDSKSDQVINNFDFDKALINKFQTKNKEEPLPIAVAMEQKVEEKKAEIKKNNPPIKLSKAKVITPIKDAMDKIAPVVSFPTDYPAEYVQSFNTSKSLWQQFSPRAPIGEFMVMDIYYAGVTVGSIGISIKPNQVIGEKEVHHFYAQMKSAPFYKLVYELDDVVESFVDVKTFLPVKYSLVQRESKHSIDDIQLFDREQLKTYFRMKKVKEGKQHNESKDVHIPYYSQDALSALFFLRGLPLKNGEKYSYYIATRGRVTKMNVEVVGVEKISTPIGERSAIHLKATTQYSGDLVKKGHMDYWLSNDDQRIFLRFDAQIKLGSVKGLIQSYKR
jgi:hypothetical protein